LCRCSLILIRQTSGPQGGLRKIYFTNVL
jgi:hypothetical protein